VADGSYSQRHLSFEALLASGQKPKLTEQRSRGKNPGHRPGANLLIAFNFKQIIRKAGTESQTTVSLTTRLDSPVASSQAAYDPSLRIRPARPAVES
jgi:hypothetical protein